MHGTGLRIYNDGTFKEGFFIDGKLKETIPGFQKIVFDWILPQRPEYKYKKLVLSWIEQDFCSYFGETLDGKMHGRGIRIQNNGIIFIGYFNTGKVPGNFMQVDWDGDIEVGS